MYSGKNASLLFILHIYTYAHGSRQTREMALVKSPVRESFDADAFWVIFDMLSLISWSLVFMTGDRRAIEILDETSKYQWFVGDRFIMEK